MPWRRRGWKGRVSVSDWAWVAAGFGIAYGAVAVYLLSLRRRSARVRARGRP